MKMRKEAMLYEKLDRGRVRCALCAHRCTIKPGRHGLCGVRENDGGVLFTSVFGEAIAVHVDPIEKKPLFNFLPGTRSFSIATVGCNFRCRFCQNSEISQASKDGLRPRGEEWPPAQVVAAATSHECESIAYTYTEPTIFFEYAYAIASMAHGDGIKNVFVTNGYMTLEALSEIDPYLDAANVDLKSFDDEFYQRQCGARLQPVLDTIQAMTERGIWVEVTTLLIPGLNDSDEELRRIAQFLVGLNPDMPWHVSRFQPRYRMLDRPRTPEATMHRAAEIGQEAGLRYVYVGNMPGNRYENTLCPSCGAVAVSRLGYSTTLNLEGHRCASCGQELAIFRS
jgi:pyruvate formate lyase activating enzyme